MKFFVVLCVVDMNMHVACYWSKIAECNRYDDDQNVEMQQKWIAKYNNHQL